MSQKSISFWHPASLISTCFGVGKIPFAPGTFGSLAGVLLFFYLPAMSMILLPILTVLGYVSIKKYNEITGSGDASEIVVDEVVGQWITFALGVGIVKLIGHNPYLSERCDVCFVIAYLICFVAFRFFDIVKPGPVGWADRNVKGAWGVMLDDIIAGVLAGITSALVFLAF